MVWYSYSRVTVARMEAKQQAKRNRDAASGPGRPEQRFQKRHKGSGLSLEKFAGAKLSTHDKQLAKDKKQALVAGRVNKYKKLKQRLAKEGTLPSAASAAQVR